MTRRLPWKKAGVRNAALIRRNTASPGLSNSPSLLPTASGQAGSVALPKEDPRRISKSLSRRSLSSKLNRSPSTSPPPQPPVETFMIEGVDHDDQYRMVEDEFHAVAGYFTAHLHAAEYHRLRNLARSQNADTIQSISRPVTSVLTDSVKRRQNILSQAKSQRKGLRKVLAGLKGGGSDNEDDNSESPWAGTSLQGLMDSPRKRAVPLAAVTHIGSGTRAAAGFRAPDCLASSALPPLSDSSRSRRPDEPWREMERSNAAEDESDESDDDLDNSVSLPQYQKRQISLMDQSSSRRSTLEDMRRMPEQTIASRRGPSIGGSSLKGSTRDTNEPSMDLDEDTFLASARRRAQGRPGRDRQESDRTVEKEAHSQSLDTIPSFF